MLRVMDYAPHIPRRLFRSQPRRLPFSLWRFVAAVAFLVFALGYVSVGLRWHNNRARAATYAQQEMNATFRAADYQRAARNPGRSEDAPVRAAEYRRLARMFSKVAEESGQLRKLYEEAW